MMRTRAILITFLLLLITLLALYIPLMASLHRRRLRYDVRIINGFTNNSSSPLIVWCASDDAGDIGGRALQERDDYGWTVEEDAGGLFSGVTPSPFICTAKWTARRRKAFEAFEPRRDRRRCGPFRQCFWLVKEDGFYFSNDGVYWVRDFTWL